MVSRLSPTRRGLIITALGSSLTVSWASSYYIPAVLAVPMAEDLGLSPVWVFGAFSMAMVVSAMVGPWAGARIDSVGGRGVLMLSNFVFSAGLGLLALAPSARVLFAGWAVIGLGMEIGLYEAGFASTVGWLNAPARVLQAAAHLIFDAALTTWGVSAIWLTAGVGLAALVALLSLRRT